MKKTPALALRLAALLTLALLSTITSPLSAYAQSTAFTYQGFLTDHGAPANGVYDFIFQVFDAASGGGSIGGSVNTNGIGVTNGLFTVALDFGSIPFTGPPRWLQISVSTNGAGSFATLVPRQEITHAPYAIYANTAGTLTNGAIANAQLAANSVAAGNIQDSAITAGKIATNQVVKSLNGLTDTVSLTQGANVTINTVGNSLQISAPAGGLALPYSGSASSSGSLFTLTNSGTGPAGVFLGNVGIGTGSPVSKLHVLAGANDVSPRLESSSTGGFAAGWDFYPGGVGKGFVGVPDSGAAFAPGELLMFGAPGVPISFWPGQARAVTVLAGGNVGIGTTAPAAKLQVSGGNALFDGNVGIGTTTPGAPLEVVGTGGNYGQLGASGRGVYGVSSSGDGVYGVSTSGDGVYGFSGTGFGVYGVSSSGTPAKFRRSGTDGIVVVIGGALDGNAGNISVSGSTVSYNAFTGSHFAWTDDTIERGTLVRLTGVNRYTGGNTNAEIIYGITRTTQANDSRCLGAYLSLLQPAKPAGNTNPCLVMAVGNGDLWVTDGGHGNLQPGDYLISAAVPGCAMKDDPSQFPVGYICARAAEGVEWSEVAADTHGVKRKKISILFESFERHGGSASLTAIQGLNEKFNEKDAKISGLEKRLENLEQLLNTKAGEAK